MPLFSGIHPIDLEADSTPLSQPGLTALVLGTAPDGDVGDVRYFNTPDSVLTAYGGNPVARLSISATDTNFTIPSHIFPDLAPIQSTSRIYDFSGESGRPQSFPYLGNLTVSQSIPVVLSFDQLGTNYSVQPSPGGLYLETQTLFSPVCRTNYAAGHGLLTSDLRIPLFSSLLEISSDDYQFAGCRMGLSWLPPAPAQTSLVVQGNGSGIHGTVIFAALGIGDGSGQDPYLNTSVIMSSGAICIDPGTSGLPARYVTYNYADYATWAHLLSQIVFDAQRGYSALTIISQPTASNFLNASPSSFFNGTESTVTQTVAYSIGASSAPDLTTAAGWADTLEAENPDTDNFGFVVLAGLTGKALANDVPSAQRILNYVIGNDPVTSNSSIAATTLVLPWDITPPTGVSISGDVASATAFMESVGLDASRIVFIWGTLSQNGMPDIQTSAGSFETQVPGAYPFLGALLRESFTKVAGNPGRPILTTGKSGPYSGFQLRTTADPLYSIRPTSLPTPANLDALQGANLIPVTRVLGSQWGFHGPITQLDGNNLQVKLAVSVVSALVNQQLQPFIGQPNNYQVRANINYALTSIADSLSNTSLPVLGLIANLSLNLIYNDALHISTFSKITIEGAMRLYSEVETVTFQTQLQL